MQTRPRYERRHPPTAAGHLTTRIRRLAAPVICAALIAAGWACTPRPDPARATRRVTLVALDGAAWRVMDPLLAAGELPNLAGLISRGCRGEMKSLLVSSSARIWTTLATGTLPRVHGVADFTHQVEGKRRLFTSRDVRVPRVWEVASAAGVRVGVTNWWFTYPSTPVNGFVISDHAIPSRSQRTNQVFSPDNPMRTVESALVHPPELWEEISGLLGEPGEPSFRLWGNDPGARARVIADIRDEDQRVVDLAMYAAAEYSPRFQLVYLKGVDRVSHRFWYEYEAGHPNFANRPPNPDLIARYQDTIPDTYRDADRLIGRLIEDLGEDDVVLLLSDHGFEAAKTGANSGTHGISDASTDGIYLMAGGPIVTQTCPAEISIFDVAPIALYLLGVAIPGQMQGEVPASLFEPNYLTANPVAWTDAMAPSQPDSAAPTPEDAAEEHRIERLRSLGYFDDGK
jgi:predicted AlkP superfamily phosphohydrolase/phosphomutase